MITYLSPKKSGFTLIELMLVVIAISVLAAFAIPNYRRSLDKAQERKVFNTLNMIRGAVEIYNARYKTYPPTNAGSTAALNTLLELDVYDPDVTYTYVAGGGNGAFEVIGTHADGWALHTHESFVDTVHCTTASCVVCDNSHAAGTPGCPY